MVQAESLEMVVSNYYPSYYDHILGWVESLKDLEASSPENNIRYTPVN